MRANKENDGHLGKVIDDEDFRGGWGAWPHEALECGERFIGLARLDGTVLDPALSLLDAIGDAQAWIRFLGKGGVLRLFFKVNCINYEGWSPDGAARLLIPTPWAPGGADTQTADYMIRGWLTSPSIHYRVAVLSP